MANVKISQISGGAKASPAGTDLIEIEEAGGTSYYAALSNLHKALTNATAAEVAAMTAVTMVTPASLSGLSSGWIPANQTWTYASATTITVPSGAAEIYSKGDKFKLTANSVVLYGYIVAVADTLLTVKGNALTNHAFSSNYYSKASGPHGFPHTFAYTPTEISAANSTTTARFSVMGNRCYVDFYIAFTGGITLIAWPSLPIVASASFKSGTDYKAAPVGIASYLDSTTAYSNGSLWPCVVASATTFQIVSTAGADLSGTAPITWANNDFIQGYFEYEI